jgi:UDP-glucose 4-epimerase
MSEQFAVTGGAGFIGSHVVDRLIALGKRVVVLDDLSVGKAANVNPSARLERVDVRDLPSLRRAIEGSQVVLHLAVQCLRVSFENPTLVHEVNATGTLNALIAARELGARFVYVSSSEVYGSAVHHEEPMAEHHPLLPTTPYGASKAAGELYTDSFHRTYGLRTTVVRPFNSYGPRSHAAGPYGEVIPRFVARVMGGAAPVIFGDGKQTRDFTYVEDTAAGIVQVALSEASVGQTVNVARGQEVTITDVARTVASVLGREDLAPIYEPARPADVRRHAAATARCRELVGFTAGTDLAEGVRRYVEWVRSTGVEVSADEARARNW